MDPGLSGTAIAVESSVTANLIAATKFIVSRDVNDFLLRHDIQSEFSLLPRQLEAAFAPESVEIYLTPSHDDDNSNSETLVLMVKSSLDQKSFRQATVRFIEATFRENPRITPLVAVLHDL